MIYRNARHTNNLKPIVEFYTSILQLEVLFSFENHNDYSGVFIGKPNHDWHLEFTISKNKANHEFDPDDIMVFYPTTINEYTDIVASIELNNIEIIKAENPFWNDHGIMIKDPDGFRVIISNMKLE